MWYLGGNSNCEGRGSRELVSCKEVLALDNVPSELLCIDGFEAVTCAEFVVLEIELAALLAKDIGVGSVAVTKDWIVDVINVAVVNVRAEFKQPDEPEADVEEDVVDDRTAVDCVELLVKSAIELSETPDG